MTLSTTCRLKALAVVATRPALPNPRRGGTGRPTKRTARTGYCGVPSSIQANGGDAIRLRDEVPEDPDRPDPDQAEQV
jgi:hypothetical protein